MVVLPARDRAAAALARRAGGGQCLKRLATGGDATCADIVAWHEGRFDPSRPMPDKWQRHIQMFKPGGKYFEIEKMGQRVYATFDLDLGAKKRALDGDGNAGVATALPSSGEQAATRVARADGALTWFCVHEPAADPAWLLRALGDEHASAIPLAIRAGDPTTVEEKAAALLPTVQAAAAGGGAIALGGVGIGGAVALELRLQLARVGVDVPSLILLDAPAPGAPVEASVPRREIMLEGLSAERWSALVGEERELQRAIEAYRPHIASGGSDGLVLHLITTGEGVGSTTSAQANALAWRDVGVATPSNVLSYACTGGREAAAAAQRILAARRGGGTSFEGYQQVSVSIAPTTAHATPAAPPFRCATGQSSAVEADAQCAESYARVVESLRAPPTTLFLTSSGSAEQAQEQLALLRALAPRATIHAVSSLGGALGADGTSAFGLFGLAEGAGRTSVGIAAASPLPEQAREAARLAVRQALAEAAVHALPDVFFLSATPGIEEAVLAGIADELGPEVPVIGGSAADQGALDGSWWVGATGPTTPPVVSQNAIAVTLLWPTVPTELVFSSCYTPTAARGIVTRAEGREAVEIDGRRAADVYVEWAEAELLAGIRTGGGAGGAVPHAPLTADALIDQNMLALSTLRPLARVSEDADGKPFYTLLHPSKVTERGGLEFFAVPPDEGSALVCMAGTRDELAGFSAGIASGRNDVQGAIALLRWLRASSRRRFAHGRRQPLAAVWRPAGDGICTHGEQGVTPSGVSSHGNLMYSMLLFGSTPKL